MKSDFDAEQVVTRFKIDLLKKMPFYGDVLSHLPFEADNTVRTACTNGYQIRYNPDFFQSLKNPGEVNFVIMHEIMHVLLRHATRMGERDPRIWNIAGDLIINDMLVRHLSEDMKNMGIPFQMPKDALFSYLKYNDTTESLYDVHLALNPSISQPSKAHKSPPAKLIVSIHPERFRPDNLQISVTPPEDLQPDRHSQSIGEKMPYSADGMTHGNVEGSAEMEAALQKILKNAMQKSRSAGGSYFIPGAVRTSLLSSERILNWKRLLKEHLSSAISDDSSYSTPERKYLHMDLILPGHGYSEEDLEEVWAFVDSSGSISQDELNRFLTQLYHLVRNMQCVLHLCYWDTCVTDVYKNIRREKEILQHPPRHTGGTDINCIYQWLREKHVRPDVMLILTDGFFGKVRSEVFLPALQKKTILIITSDSMAKNPDMKKIGRVASL